MNSRGWHVLLFLDCVLEMNLIPLSTDLGVTSPLSSLTSCFLACLTFQLFPPPASVLPADPSIIGLVVGFLASTQPPPLPFPPPPQSPKPWDCGVFSGSGQPVASPQPGPIFLLLSSSCAFALTQFPTSTLPLISILHLSPLTLTTYRCGFWGKKIPLKQSVPNPVYHLLEQRVVG